MAKSKSGADRLDRLTVICLALPEANREVMGDHAAFTVRGKKFAYYLNSHHGDGIVSVCFKTEPGENEVLLAADPARFYSPAYIGPSGWVGLRLDKGKIDWDEVSDFVADSYRLQAPSAWLPRYRGRRAEFDSAAAPWPSAKLSRRGRDLQRIQKGDELCFLVAFERGEPVAGVAALAVVRQDRGGEALRTAVVEERGR